MRIASGVTDQYIYFVAVDSTDYVTRETGLTTFTVYRSRNGAAAAAMTTPTVNETDTTNMPGVYELLLDEDMTIGADNVTEEMVFHITHAGMAPVTRVIELYQGINATALIALEDQFDGTGLSGDTYPATQSQLSGLSIASAALSVPVLASPDGFVLTTGSEVNTEDVTRALDGVRHELSDTAGTLDCYYIFDIGPFGKPVSATFESVVNGGNDTFGIYVNVGSSGTPSWSQRQTITGTGSTSNVTIPVELFEDDVLTDDPTRVWLRVYGTGLTTSSFDTDRLALSRSILPQYSGYDNGAVWTDTTGGTSGTVLGYNGIASRPTLTFAEALTIANNLGTHRHEFSNDSSVTLTSSTTNKILSGRGWTLALGGQDISNIHVLDSKVSGIGTGSEVEFHDCPLIDVTLPNGAFHNCAIRGTFTCSAAGTYHFHQSHSGNGTVPTIDIGAAVGNTVVLMHNWKGAFNVDNLGATGTDIINLAGDGEITLNASCVGGTVNIQGNWKVTNNGSGITINYDDNTTNIAAILADTVSIGITKNQALSNFEILMVDSTNTPKIGLTVTAERSIDGAAFEAVSGSIAEVGSGIYQFDALAADTNGDLITWKFSATGAVDRFVTFKTRA